MTQPFYCTQRDARGEYEEYFLDGGAYVRRERVLDAGQALTVRTDILPTTAFFRSFWSDDAKKELTIVLATADAAARYETARAQHEAFA